MLHCWTVHTCILNCNCLCLPRDKFIEMCADLLERIRIPLEDALAKSSKPFSLLIKSVSSVERALL